MVSRRAFLLGSLAVGLNLSKAHAEPIPDDAIRAILRERVDADRQSVGMVAGLLHATGRLIVTYGRSDSADNRPLDGDTVFEIGSITKVFTALLLADMAVKGELALDDPVAKYLPANVTVPSRNGKQITLLDLATYSSGLPNDPTNLPKPDGATLPEHFNPYENYTAQDLYAFLSGFSLKFDPGAHYEYANLGFGLLGHVLSLKANQTYEDLVVSRICTPLGMESTRISLSPSMRERLARGHTSILDPTENWELKTLAGTGALRSTANDLFLFLDAASGLHPNDGLRAAMEMLLKTRRPAYGRNVKVGLGWFVTQEHEDDMVGKAGGTGGYSTHIGFSTKTRSASVVLSNAGYNANDDIGNHLANTDFPLLQYPPIVAVDPAILASYAGTYAMSPKFSLTIRASSGRLFVRGTDQVEYELFADSADHFFMRSVDAQAIFHRDNDGQVRQLIWRQNDAFSYCRRV
jgi:serine-type D-Ala-D-Ala carboxypeptidase/endopeptidase